MKDMNTFPATSVFTTTTNSQRCLVTRILQAIQPLVLMVVVKVAKHVSVAVQGRYCGFPFVD